MDRDVEGQLDRGTERTGGHCPGSCERVTIILTRVQIQIRSLRLQCSSRGVRGRPAERTCGSKTAVMLIGLWSHPLQVFYWTWNQRV